MMLKAFLYRQMEMVIFLILYNYVQNFIDFHWSLLLLNYFHLFNHKYRIGHFSLLKFLHLVPMNFSQNRILFQIKFYSKVFYLSFIMLNFSFQIVNMIAKYLFIYYIMLSKNPDNYINKFKKKKKVLKDINYNEKKKKMTY